MICYSPWSRCLGIAGYDLFFSLCVSFPCMGGLSNLVNLANIALLLLFFGILLWEFSRAKELGALVCSWNFAFGGAIGFGQRRRCSYYPILGVHCEINKAVLLVEQIHRFFNHVFVVNFFSQVFLYL